MYRIAYGVVVILFGFVCLAGCAKKQVIPKEITFQNDLRTALNLAAEKRLPILAFFFRPDCPWSRMMDDSTFSNKIVIGMSASMIFARIDISQDSAIARRYGITFFPTTIVFKNTGEEIDRLVGYYPPADYFNEVQLFLQGRETLADYLVRLADEPENVDYLMAIAEKYRNKSDFVEALKYYEMILKSNQADSLEHHIPVLFELGTLYGELHDTSKAFDYFEKFISASRDSLKIQDAYRRKGYYRAGSGNKDGAIAQYKKYLAEFPGGVYAAWVRERIEELRIAQEGSVQVVR